MIRNNGDLRHCDNWGLKCTHVQLLVMVVFSMFGNSFVLKAASSPGVKCTNSASTRLASYIPTSLSITSTPKL